MHDAYRDSCGICTEQRCETPCYNSFSNESKVGEDEMTQAEWLELAGTLPRSHDQGGGVVGGFAMAWTDEAWKTTTHYPTSICSDNTLKSKNGGWNFATHTKNLDPKPAGLCTRGLSHPRHLASSLWGSTSPRSRTTT